ncbi:MAG: transglycosylase domain-containing protein, partial [Pseudomonadota bacterium]
MFKTNMGRSKKRQTKRKSERKRWPFALRVFVWAMVLGCVLSLVGAGVLAGVFFYVDADRELPRMSSIHEYKPKAVTRIYDRNGIVIGEISAERRTVVPFARIPEILVKAVVAAEDADFYTHRGLDYMGMLRAFFANLRAGRFVQGGSTITQQVVKTFFLSPDRKIKRKMQEVILARRLESELPKNEILGLYLNQIYFGHGRYGVQEASQYFFGKDVERLDIAEAAMLAGLPQSPERLSPLKHPRRAKSRQVYVLEEMTKGGYLDKTTAKEVAEKPIQVVRHVRPYYNAAPEITDLVRYELIEKHGEDKLATMGLSVRASVDVKLQLMAKEALQQGLRALDARHGYRGRVKNLNEKKRDRMLRWLSRKQKETKEGEHYQGIVVEVDDEDESLEVNLGSKKVKALVDDERYNPNKNVPSKRFAPGDLIWVRAGRDAFRFDGGPQGAMVVMDSRNGDVLAMVGGYDFSPGDFNRATRALRQPGSAFKPFVYAAAL